MCNARAGLWDRALRISLRYAGIEEGLHPWQVADHHSLSRKAVVGTKHTDSLGQLQFVG